MTASAPGVRHMSRWLTLALIIGSIVGYLWLTTVLIRCGSFSAYINHPTRGILVLCSLA